MRYRPDSGKLGFEIGTAGFRLSFDELVVDFVDYLDLVVGGPNCFGPVALSIGDVKSYWEKSN